MLFVFNVSYLILILGFIFLLLLTIYAFIRLGHGWSWRMLFKDFRRKMWMTISLGSIFFSLYLLFVYLSAYLVHQWKADLFLLFYRHPVEFVYAGLWLFAFLSLTIYLTRMFIKYFYLTKGKDS